MADGTTGATVDVAREKAYAAAGFQSPTSAMEGRAKTTNPGILAIDSQSYPVASLKEQMANSSVVSA
jgi:uncharacterized protein GlcG (DUF336 family)